jgi:hypothetical protein
MASRVKFTLPDGTTKEVEANEVSVTKSEEPWSRFELDDGSVLRVKPILAKVLRTNEFDKDGNPVYQATFGTAIFVDAPEHLKKKEGKEG